MAHTKGAFNPWKYHRAEKESAIATTTRDSRPVQLNIATKSLQELMHSAPQGRATLQYLRNLDKYKYEKPYYLSWDIPLNDKSLRTNQETETRTVGIHDLRSLVPMLRLESHGFELITLSKEYMHEFFEKYEALSLSEGITRLLQRRFDTEHVYCYDLVVRGQGCHPSEPWRE
jgi:hypothetical protein